MPELIEKGYIYVAQPPLYKTKKGSSEVYHHNQEDLDNSLINSAVNEGAILSSSSGTKIMGNDLVHVVKLAKKAEKFLTDLNYSGVKAEVLEAMCVVGACSSSILEGTAEANTLLEALERKLNTLEVSHERTWKVKLNAEETAKTIVVTKSVRGVFEEYIIKEDLLNSIEIQMLYRSHIELRNFFSEPSTLTIKDANIVINGPLSLLNAIFESAKKGMYLQRYKGLGEMNPEQLWETTLDPLSRSLVQITVDSLEEADLIFSTLMGDVVEPRREFIQVNALNAKNIDI
jgi:DNA gyrase subunit B